MANTVEPQVFINYISQRKKIIVSAANSPTQLIIKTDGNLNEVYNFQIIDGSQRIVQLDTQARYQIYGTLTDAKNIQHVLFFTNSFSITNNVLTFVINTHTSQYQKYITGSGSTEINISIVKRKGEYSSMVLRDIALAYRRPDIGGIPTQIVYEDVFTTVVPLSTAFGAGNLITLTETIDDQGESREVVTFAFGTNLSTSYDNQFVIGYNNTPDATKAFIVANSGNIFTVDYEGNVEAGDLNVGAISATSITVSGEDLNQVIDDKVEYLSTSIDDKLSATEDWVSNTFETKESATQTFNELEQDISDISAFVSGLPTDIAFKADQVDLDEANQNINTVSGQVEYLSGVIDQHTSDIGDLNNAVGSKANQTDLEALSSTVEGLSTSIGDVDSKVDSLSTLVVDDYATKTELGAVVDAIPSDADISGIASAVTESYGYITSDDVPVYTGVSPISVDPSTYQISLEGEVGETYYAGTGIALDEETNTFSLTGTVLSGGNNIKIENNIVSITGDIGGTYTAGTGIGIDGNEISLTASVSDIDGYDTLALTSDLTGLATKDEISDFITEDALTGLATKDELTAYAEKTDLTDYAEKSELTAYATKDDLTGYVENDTLTSYATKQYVTDATSAFITIEDVPPGSVYGVGTGLAASGEANNIFYLTGTVLSGGDHIKIENNVVSLTGDVGKTYTGDGGIEVNNSTNTISISANYLSSNALNGYAEQSWVEENFLTGTTTIPSKISDLTNDSQFTTSAQVSAIVEGYEYQNAAQVSSIVEGYNYITAEGIPNTYALKTDIPSNSDISGIASAVTTGIVTKEYVNALGIDGTTYTAGIGLGLDQTEGKHEFYLTAQIPTDNEITGLAKDYVDTLDIATTYATKDELSSKANTADVYSKTVADQTFAAKTDISDFATSANVSAIVTGYNYITSADIPAQYVTETELGTVLADYTKTADLNIPTDDDISGIAEDVVESLSTTIRTGLATTDQIPTTVAELTDASNYALKSELIDTEDVSGIVENMSATIINGLATESFVTTQGYITDAALIDYAQLSDIPTSATISGIASAVTQNYITVSGLATQEWVTEQGYSTSNLTAVSQLTNDVGFITGYEAGTGIAINNGVISATGGGGGGTTYTAGDYISLANDTIAVTGLPSQIQYISGVVSNLPTTDTTYQAGYGLALSTDNTFVLTAETGGGSADPTNQQTISTGFTYSSGLQVANNSYTPVDNVITLSAFTVPADSLDEGKVATFEEWVYSKGTLTGFVFEGVKLVNELPNTISQTNYYVFRRRILGSGQQLISFDYCDTDWNNAPLTFKAKQASKIALNKTGNPSAITLQYSKNGGQWTNYSVTQVIDLNAGETVSFSGANETISNNYHNNYNFAITGLVEGKGNTQSLINFNTTATTWCFGHLFKNCSGLLTAPNLPATTLERDCYADMFFGCTSLTTPPPELPATTAAQECYYEMFWNCSSLTSVPVILATDVDNQSCRSMFYNCSNLTDGPMLMFTTIDKSDLAACVFMFSGCTSLSSIGVSLTSWNAGGALNPFIDWVTNVASNGVFYCPSSLGTQTGGITRGTANCPQNWTVVNTD